MKSDKELYEFCKDHYYCDEDDDGERALWEPFEFYKKETVESYIRQDVKALRRFLGPKEWDEESN